MARERSARFGQRMPVTTRGQSSLDDLSLVMTLQKAKWDVMRVTRGANSERACRERTPTLAQGSRLTAVHGGQIEHQHVERQAWARVLIEGGPRG